jgi:hypothetical protein
MKSQLFFRWWYVRMLIELRMLPYKMKLQTELIRSDCIMQIQRKIKVLYLSLKARQYRAGVKQVQNLRARLQRSAFGNPTFAGTPLFGQSEIVKVKLQFFVYSLILIAFLAPETFIYYLTASLFTPGAPNVVKLSVATFLALVIMLTLSFGLRKLCAYREAVQRKSMGQLTDQEFRQYRYAPAWGYFVVGITYAAVVLAGLARVFYLEFIPANGLSEEKLESVRRASRAASIFTVLITLASAYYTAALKLELSKIAERFYVYRYWNRTHRRENKNYQGLIRESQKLLLKVEKCTEQGWQVIIDLKRVYKLEQEYDLMYQLLNEEYTRLKVKPGFSVDAQVYARFAPIQCAHRELFEFGVTSTPEIKEKVAFARAVLAMPGKHIESELEVGTQDASGHKTILALPPSNNGKAKHNEFRIP